MARYRYIGKSKGLLLFSMSPTSVFEVVVMAWRIWRYPDKAGVLCVLDQGGANRTTGFFDEQTDTKDQT